jgi:class 3 adenylate cyclase
MAPSQESGPRAFQLPRPGQHLGRFTVRRRLGPCPLGAELLAEDPWLQAEVALQLLDPGRLAGPAFEAVTAEVAVQRRLAHPNVRRVFDLHESSGLRFLALEAVAGPWLPALLTRAGGGGLQVVQAVGLAVGAGEALAHAHGQGAVHGDLRPEHLWLRGDAGLAVGGFGRRPEPGSRLLPPELMHGGEPDALSDQYALGALLYLLLTGRAPLDTLGAVRESSGQGLGRPERPARLNPQVTRPLEALIMTALSPTPQHRFQDVRALLDELHAMHDEVSTRARRPRRRGQESQPELPTPTTERSGTPLQTERATLLFSDIVGITHFFEAHGDVAGRQRIERHNALLFPVIRRHTGTVLKTIGDAIMASFEDEDEAVEAAIHMQQVLARHNLDAPAEADEIRIRIGINTGETIAEYGDAYGDAVNVAARVSAKAEGDQILIAEDTRRALTRNLALVQPHSRVVLKGKQGVFQLYLVAWRQALEHDEELAPDLSADPDEEAGSPLESTVTSAAPTADHPAAPRVVDNLAAAARALQASARPAKDRLLDFLGIQGNGRAKLALGLLGATSLLLLLALVLSLCGSPPA